jgi:hypothetical protein
MPDLLERLAPLSNNRGLRTVISEQVAPTCGLGPRPFIRNRAFRFRIRVWPSMARSARSLPSQIGHTKTARADVTPRSSTRPPRGAQGRKAADLAKHVATCFNEIGRGDSRSRKLSSLKSL